LALPSIFSARASSWRSAYAWVVAIAIGAACSFDQGDRGHLAHRPPDSHRLLDHEVHTDHRGHRGVLLGPQHVVDLLVDRGEIVGDLGYGLLHPELGHRTRQAGQEPGVGQPPPRPLHEFDEALDLAVFPLEHAGGETRRGVPPQPVLTYELGGLLRQFHPAPGLGGDFGAELGGFGRAGEEQPQTAWR
jgi:hypothetical protein